MSVRLTTDSIGQKFVTRNNQIVQVIAVDPAAQQDPVVVRHTGGHISARNLDGSYPMPGQPSEDLVGPYRQPPKLMVDSADGYTELRNVLMRYLNHVGLLTVRENPMDDTVDVTCRILDVGMFTVTVAQEGSVRGFNLGHITFVKFNG